MVAREDCEFLARVARINRALAASALALVNGELDAIASNELGTELIAIGHEYVRRSQSQHPAGRAAGVIERKKCPYQTIHKGFSLYHLVSQKFDSPSTGVTGYSEHARSTRR
ncbi:hypothetical protein [Saccharopolyspora phatthalungensis]|uniref:Uncharacterized protein n=1 Tax=Saccharopolyspora phatthalungensis TaxID=664693 RepID=A0A840Q7V6_9PSEU|nr:hypothetical protein [Saccharopolyspora phatthalungensis]MBB5155940.1 hypothetical protein [Saccharopolyspora phatthalungensis]